MGLQFAKRPPSITALCPFLSRDCDLLGDQALLFKLAQVTGWKPHVTSSGQASPVVGYLRGKDQKGDDLLIEVLHTIHGLSNEELRKAEISLDLNGVFYKTLSPVALLKAKIANSVDLPQEDRDDVRHVQVLVLCVSAYIEMVHSMCLSGMNTSERDLIQVLKAVLAVIKSDKAQAVANKYQIGFKDCFPEVVFSSPLPKVRNFCLHQLFQAHQKEN